MSKAVTVAPGYWELLTDGTNKPSSDNWFQSLFCDSSFQTPGNYSPCHHGPRLRSLKLALWFTSLDLIHTCKLPQLLQSSSAHTRSVNGPDEKEQGERTIRKSDGREEMCRRKRRRERERAKRRKSERVGERDKVRERERAETAGQTPPFVLSWESTVRSGPAWLKLDRRSQTVAIYR